MSMPRPEEPPEGTAVGGGEVEDPADRANHGDTACFLLYPSHTHQGPDLLLRPR